MRFLSQAIALEEGRPPRGAMLTILVGVTLFGMVMLWSSMTQVEKVAMATGQVVPVSMVQSIQHLEGGIVREIRASEGRLVERGEVILRLDPTGMQAELDQLRARESGLALQVERLRAFAERRPAQLSGSQQLVMDQEAVLQTQVRARETQREVLERQVATRRAELATLQAQHAALVRQSEIIGETLEMRLKLLKAGLVSRLLYLETERESARLRGEVAQAVTNMRRAEEAIAEAQARLVETEARLASDSLAEMGRLSAELAQVREGIARAVDRVTRLEIRSPVRGVVKDLRFRTIGGVVPPGAQVTEVVPIDDGLIAEVKISPRDIGHVRVGQDVTAKVSTYDFSRYGVVAGTLSGISASTFQEGDGQVFYRGFVTFEKPGVGDVPERNPLLPGMVLQADIRLGSRSVLEYLLTPIYASLAGAFHER
jgi:HlyD family secretion protein/adhesin transport system membrane fusion protein